MATLFDPYDADPLGGCVPSEAAATPSLLLYANRVTRVGDGHFSFPCLAAERHRGILRG
jgi:hypothetical protein